MSSPSEFTENNKGKRLAFSRTKGLSPEIVFLGGYASDMQGTKALCLEAHAAYLGHAFTRFDYSGHGQSSGEFGELLLSDWLDDTLFVLDEIVRHPFILVGSSMGGWLMLHAALARKERLRGLVGIAAAPDFTERLLEPHLSEAQRAELSDKGRIEIPSEYGDPLPLTSEFLKDGAEHSLLRAPIELGCPVHLVHGQEDVDVPWNLALDLAGALQSPHVTIELIKDGDHRLSREQDIRRITHAVDRILDANI